MKKLTAASIPSLPEGEYPDAYCPGLILRVGSRRLTWVFRYRQGGKRHFDRIGFFPALGLADARGKAGELGKRIDVGLRAVPAPVMHPRSPNALSVGRLVDRYEEARRRKGGRIRQLDRSMRAVRNGLGDYLELPAKQLSKADLREARDRIAGRAPHQADRFLAYLGPIWRWAYAEDLVDANIVAGLLKVTSVTKRDRVLSSEEIAKIWHACSRLDRGPTARSFGRLVRFLLVTAQRRGEAAALRYGAILDGTWRQSAGDNKAGRAHSLKLPQLALDQVGQGEARALCFSGEGGVVMSGFSKLKAALDEASGVSGWRLHDLRRSAASGMQALGVDKMVIHGVLNHALGGLAEVYMRAELEAAKADALQRWAVELTRIVGKRRVAP